VNRLFGSVKSKLLLACAGFLTAITLLHTALTAWVINRHGQVDASNQLSRQLMQLQDDLQAARDALVAVAQETAHDDKNLSDLAILSSEAFTLNRQTDHTAPADPFRSRALSLQKIASLNRLQLILASARLSSLAVYLDGELSHYVTRDEAGISIWRGTQRLMVGTGHRPGDTSDIGDPQHWPERALPLLIVPRRPTVSRVTMTFEFPADQLMVLRVMVPVQGVPRESFNETILEHLTIATGAPPPADTDGPTPRLIGQFVFSTAFTSAFLQDAASKTGVLPAVSSADGRHRFELIPLVAPPEFVSGRDDQGIYQQTSVIDGTSYYQAFKRWRLDGDKVVILGGALSRAGTLANIRRAIALVTVAAAAILSIGMVLGYVWISWMVTPINALTDAARSMDLDASDTLGQYLAQPVRPRTADEIGALTVAFNAMAGRLHDLIGTLEQQVRERTSQIEAANKELESFSYSVSHDLRAPLRSLDGFSRALLEDQSDRLDATGRDYLVRIRAASQRMGHLIDDLLGLAHVSRVGLQRLPVDLTALATAIADDLRAGDPTRSAELIIASDLHATGDPRLLQVLLQNLLQNAWKFTSTRPLARIECGLMMCDGTRAYFVRDNGVGFDMTYAHKLFGAFQRLHSTAEFPGTGIGLATVQRIVHRHGGRVWAESELDAGATFYFTL
jgi:signal transduction histidine kinase